MSTSTEREQVMSQNETSVSSATAALLGLRFVRVEVNAARHGIVVYSGPVPTCGTSVLGGNWSPKLRGVEDLFRYFLERFANSNRSLCRSFDEKRVHTTSKGFAFGGRYLSGEFLH